MSDREQVSGASGGPGYTGRDVLYRDGVVRMLDVQRAADALLRGGKKPSVAALREHLGGGSPNTLAPLLAKYWESLGQRLGAGPDALERVPESLARVTELLWRRAVDEARERQKILESSDASADDFVALQDQVMKLSVALAEARAREGEHLTHLAALSKEWEALRTKRASLLALLKGSQALLEQQNARVGALERARSKDLSAPTKPFKRSRAGASKTVGRKPRQATGKRVESARKRAKARKPK
jgi:hypothetical protein